MYEIYTYMYIYIYIHVQIFIYMYMYIYFPPTPQVFGATMECEVPMGALGEVATKVAQVRTVTRDTGD